MTMPPLFPVSSTPSWSASAGDGIEATRARLSAEIAATRDATAATRQRITAREAEVQAALRDEVERSRHELAEMEEKYEKAIALVREAARIESEQILKEARRQAALRLGQSPARSAGSGPHD